jgi:hypothetical protein
LNTISQIFDNMPDRGLPDRLANENVAFLQNEAFFYLAVAKDARISKLKAYFAKCGLRKVFLGANLASFCCAIDGIDVTTLERDFFLESNSVRLAEKKAQLEGCIVIINNNDAARSEFHAAYPAFFEGCTTTCFIAWDWDNHHWLKLSPFLAAHSDIYAPAHHENLYLLSRYNWLIAGPVYSSTVQWSRTYLTQHLPEILAAERSNAPLGMHIPYSEFDFRLQVISTLSPQYPSIGFSTFSFHGRTLEDRLREWYSHKTHWIVPVLNDVPIRIFDALITGGIPIVPNSMRLLPPVNTIPREHISFYSPSDIVNPMKLVEKSNLIFDDGGYDGIVARHEMALQFFHGDTSIHKILSYACEVLEIEAVL